MMNVNIYQVYKIKRKIDCAFIDEENSVPNDITFKDLKKEDEISISGGQLLEYLAKLLNDGDISEFEIKDNKIKIVHFNPNTGEGTETYIEVVESK